MSVIHSLPHCYPLSKLNSHKIVSCTLETIGVICSVSVVDHPLGRFSQGYLGCLLIHCWQIHLLSFGGRVGGAVLKLSIGDGGGKRLSGGWGKSSGGNSLWGEVLLACRGFQCPWRDGHLWRRIVVVLWCIRILSLWSIIRQEINRHILTLQKEQDGFIYQTKANCSEVILVEVLIMICLRLSFYELYIVWKMYRKYVLLDNYRLYGLIIATNLLINH